jgi:hypothetical protein
MNRLKCILTLLFTFLIFSSYEMVTSPIVGKWMIYKVKSKETRKIRIIYQDKEQHFSEYLDNGKFKNYTIINGDTIGLIIGNWTFNVSKKTIKKINITDVPHDPINIFNDHEISLVRVSKDKLITKEYFDSEIGPDIVYFKRVK